LSRIEIVHAYNKYISLSFSDQSSFSDDQYILKYNQSSFSDHRQRWSCRMFSLSGIKGKQEINLSKNK